MSGDGSGNKSCSTCALIRLVPQVLHDVVDFFHLECVIFHDGAGNDVRRQFLLSHIFVRRFILVKCLGILVQIVIRHIRDLGVGLA